MNTNPGASFSEFIEFFPELGLPLSLLPDIGQIPSQGQPLPLRLIEAFILPFEGTEADDYTEYIPYGRLAGLEAFEALIYWKAGILQYEFVLATFTKQGLPVSHAIIGGVRSEDEGLLHSVAVIHEDLTITIAEGIDHEMKESILNDATTYQMQIDSNGEIKYGSDDEG